MPVREKVNIVVGSWRLVCQNDLWTWGGSPIFEMSRREALDYLECWWADCMRVISARLRMGFHRGVDPMIDQKKKLADNIQQVIDIIETS